ncbi:helix-turn-helix transcriptional regulator [Candidatus Woesebacteria bacterium]|nr:helix-turn-helix transcriptional regulator [Candidatus Woesebacteria bacterium]
MDKKDIGEKIRQIRMLKRISQGKLGEELGKSHAAISDIELGKTELTVTDLTKIATFFNIPITEIVGNEARKKGPNVQFRNEKNITKEERQLADEFLNEFRDFLQKRRVNEKSK